VTEIEKYLIDLRSKGELVEFKEYINDPAYYQYGNNVKIKTRRFNFPLDVSEEIRRIAREEGRLPTNRFTIGLMNEKIEKICLGSLFD
jgi:hypothetical protein